MRAVVRIFAVSLALSAHSPVAVAQQNPDGRLPVLQAPEPYLLLIRDPAVHAALSLSDAQRAELDRFNASADGPLWTTRNQSQERATEIGGRLLAEARERLKALFSEEQRRRLAEIERRTLGLRAFSREDVIQQMQLTETQQQRMRDLFETMQQNLAELVGQSELAAAAEQEALRDRHRDVQLAAQKEILGVLRADQRARWTELLGEPFDLSTLGAIRFQAPEFVDTGDWINSAPLTLESLRGKVVAVHFWTFGCVNCIRNYPCYKDWARRFAGRDFVIVGIHTPEALVEHNVGTLKSKIAEHELTFAVLVDNEGRNWNAWGNSVWPSVYLVDKRGQVRYWWLGELNWEGAHGEQTFRERIAGLLAE